MKVKEGDLLPGVCCPGFEWEVVLTQIEIWGVCYNPDCPEFEYYDDPYRGVSHFCEEDIEEIMMDKIKQILDLAAKLPTGLIDKKAEQKMYKECRELQSTPKTDRIGRAMEAGDVAYYAIKAWYNEILTISERNDMINLAAQNVDLGRDTLLEVVIAKYSLRAAPGNPKNDLAEREAVGPVLKELSC